MKHQAIDHAPANRKKDSALYGLLWVVELSLLYFGFSYLLLGEEVPPLRRLFGALACFPLAAAAGWWAGLVYLKRKGENYPHPMLVLNAPPFRVFLGLLLATAVIAVLSLAGVV